MPRKAIFHKDDIVNAAVTLIEEEGLEKFSVRNVARRLKGSTQPIYSQFKDSGALYEAVLAEIKRRFLQHISYPYTDILFRNMGFGFAYFARDYPRLFLAFFSDEFQNKTFVSSFLEDLRVALDKDERFLSMSVKGKDRLLEKMWTFTFGYSNLIIKGLVADTSNTAIETMIVEVGTAVIKDAMAQEGLI